MNESLSTSINYRDTVRFEHQRGARAAQISLDLGKVAMFFSRIERVPRYSDGKRENDVEHSYMLALVAPEIASSLKLDLDTGLLSQYAIVHDLIELKTGDVATFLFSEDSQLQKELDEQAALRALLDELPPHTATVLLKYESQRDEESRFVRYIDKLLPIVVDVIGAGKRVMHEDYNVHSLDELSRCHEKLHARLVEKFGSDFPEIDLAHQLLCELFEQCFDDDLAS